MSAFRQEIGNLVLTNPVPMGLALREKMIEAIVYWPGSGINYDGEDVKFYSDPQPSFCLDVDERAAAQAKERKDVVQRNQDELRDKNNESGSGDENNEDGSEDQNSGDENSKGKGKDDKKHEDEKSEDAKDKEAKDGDEKNER